MRALGISLFVCSFATFAGGAQSDVLSANVDNSVSPGADFYL
ncbi:MAG TPA: hypothetical protein VF239_20225 [Vicinamibacterales bacterium]